MLRLRPQSLSNAVTAARRFTSSTAGKPIECLAAVAWQPEPDASKVIRCLPALLPTTPALFQHPLFVSPDVSQCLPSTPNDSNSRSLLPNYTPQDRDTLKDSSRDSADFPTNRSRASTADDTAMTATESFNSDVSDGEGTVERKLPSRWEAVEVRALQFHSPKLNIQRQREAINIKTC